MSDDVNILSGTCLSELGESGLIDQDCLVISKHVDEETGYLSRKMSYLDLKTQIYKDLIGMFPFDSMVSCDPNMFSPADHKHGNYNRVAVDLPYENTEGAMTIAKIRINGVTRDLKVKPVKFPNPHNPVPGQIKFVAIGGFDVDVDSEEFDGWVFADGKTYQTHMFEHGRYFEQIGNGSFKVPLFNDMIYALSETNWNITNEIVQQENDTPRHRHSFRISPQDNIIPVDVEIDSYPARTGNGVHGATCKSQGSVQIGLDADLQILDIRSNGDTVKKCGEIGDLTRPRLQKIPVMVYIGKKVV